MPLECLFTYRSMAKIAHMIFSIVLNKIRLILDFMLRLIFLSYVKFLSFENSINTDHFDVK